MVKNFFRVAWRNLVRGKGYSIINIVGLSTGMAVALLIGLWVTDELNYDGYHTKHQQLAEIMLNQTMDGETSTGPVISTAMDQPLRTGYGRLFTNIAMVSTDREFLLGSGDKNISVDGMWAQWQFPGMFTLKMVSGSADALKDPSTILIDQPTALALFGTSDPLNKVIRVENNMEMTIGGVYEALPHNTTFYEIHVLLPWGNKENRGLSMNTNWDDHSALCFVQLADGISAEQATARVKNLPTPLFKEWHEEIMVHPLDKVHLYSEFHKGKAAGGPIQFVRLFALIGAFVLLLACINFMNLSTARSEKRAREVGIRKTVGSMRIQLIWQFLTESVVVSFCSLILSLLLVSLTLDYFNGLAGKKMVIPWSSSIFWLLVTGFTLLTGLLSGSYPAFYLSGFRPVKVLKGTFRAGRYASLPRKVLVVLQFSVSLTLIISTIIVFRQIQYAKDRPVGYSKDRLITVNINTPELASHFDALRRDLLNTGVVDNTAESSQPTTYFSSNNDLDWKGRDRKIVVFFRNVYVSPEFGKTIGWTVSAGRDFSREFATDSNAMVLNEAAVKAIGHDPIGEVMKFGGKEWTVIGVVKDMLTNSPWRAIEPAIFLGNGWMSTITIKVSHNASMRQALAGIEPVFHRYNPGSPFLYTFNSDNYARKFADETRIGYLATVFAFLAIFISCLGLFGLASFIAEQRTREIGIRKVLGADLLTLWGLLSRDFAFLVFLSLFIAIPLSYYVMHQWLQQYTYRTAMPWWVFLTAGAGLMLITLLTVSYQSLKAALINPAKSLRAD